jgi:hypothetical protein
VATFFVNTDAKSNEGHSYHDAWVARGIAVTSGRVKFRQKLARIARGDTVLMYANGLGVVAVGTALDDEVVDVTDSSALVSPRESIEYHRQVDWHSDLRSTPISASILSKLCGRAPRQVVERLEKGEAQRQRLAAQLAAQRSTINLDGEQIEEHGSFPEGAVRRVSINAYERNPDARRVCVSRYGTQCAACGVVFGDVYGPAAQGFIHVHHLIPLSKVGPGYQVNPITDLRPVCPNCHGVIHLRTPPYSIEEMQSMIQGAAGDEKRNHRMQPVREETPVADT